IGAYIVAPEAILRRCPGELHTAAEIAGDNIGAGGRVPADKVEAGAAADRQSSLAVGDAGATVTADAKIVALYDVALCSGPLDAQTGIVVAGDNIASLCGGVADTVVL